MGWHGIRGHRCNQELSGGSQHHDGDPRGCGAVPPDLTSYSGDCQNGNCREKRIGKKAQAQRKEACTNHGVDWEITRHPGLASWIKSSKKWSQCVGEFSPNGWYGMPNSPRREDASLEIGHIFIHAQRKVVKDEVRASGRDQQY